MKHVALTIIAVASFFISIARTCSDAKSPAVAETSSVLTANWFLVGVSTISPLRSYYQNLPLLDAIRDSLMITGNDGATGNPESGTALAKTELDKACLVGVFAPEHCARRLDHHRGRRQWISWSASTLWVELDQRDACRSSPERAASFAFLTVAMSIDRAAH